MSADPPRRRIALALVALAAGLLGTAYALPTVTYHRFGARPETYSIYGGIEVLWQDGNVVLAAIVFAFSIVFPVAKLAVLLALLGERFAPQRRARLAELGRLLGKWSMLDVFVVGGFVGAMRLGIATGTSRPGIHVFAGAIVASMLAADRVARLVGVEDAVPEGARLRRPGAALLSLATLVALACAFATYLFEVRVRLVWVNHVGLGRTTRALFEARELGLAAALGVLVLALPAARALAALVARWTGSRAWGRAALRLDEWGMLDVFALALGIVWVKLDELATTTVRAGFWWVLIAAVVGEWDAWRLRAGAQKGCATDSPEQG